MGKITLTSDGTPGGTKLAFEDGRPVHGVSKVKFEIAAGEISCATVDLELVPVVITADAKFLLVHPLTGERTQISGVVLADGSKSVFFAPSLCLSQPVFNPRHLYDEAVVLTEDGEIKGLFRLGKAGHELFTEFALEDGRSWPVDQVELISDDGPERVVLKATGEVLWQRDDASTAVVLEDPTK